MDDKTLEYMRTRVKRADAIREDMRVSEIHRSGAARNLGVTVGWRDKQGSWRVIFDNEELPKTIADAIVAYFDQRLSSLKHELDAI